MHNVRRALRISILTSILFTTFIYSQDRQAHPAHDEGWVSLFNGRDLCGWVPINCAPNTFSVQDNTIVSTGIPTGLLRTERQYENFEIELEWRHLKPGGNAGLFLWGDPVTAPGTPFARGMEVQILDNGYSAGGKNEWYTTHGDVFPVHGASMTPTGRISKTGQRSFPTEDRCKDSPQWNHYRVVANHGTIRLSVNGKEVTVGKDCSPRKGYICLESEGSECHFRNIRIRELPSTYAGPTETAPLAQGFVPLYNGVDLQGWKTTPEHAAHWQAQDWRLNYDGQCPSSDPTLWTEKSYGDFVLICDWRWTGKAVPTLRPVILPSGEQATDANGYAKQEEVPDAGDSGIYLRGSTQSQVNMWCWPIGSGEVYGYRTDRSQSASVRAAVTPARRADNPIGKWNRFIITLRGDRLTVNLNGQIVIEQAQLPDIEACGPIGLQHHGAPIQFANILIRELDSTDDRPKHSRSIDLRPYADETTPLANPHKGWYHHFPDNHINKYRIARDADLLDFPGMDHVYIRLAWAYLEPQEGHYHWDVIDKIIDKWVGHGLGISFRISCKETSTDRPEQQYATPRWVKQAGAKGGHFRMGKPTDENGPWEPVFDDPIYLQKLDRFLAVFAGRYDGKPWLRYIDIGSIGDWGEGHTWAGSRREYGYDARKLHVDLYAKHFRKTQLITTDDFVYSVSDPKDRRRMHQLMLERNISYRDDSILVNGYLAGTSDSWTVRSPEFFADAYLRMPTVFELEHYSAVKRLGNWTGEPGSSLGKYGGGKSGADFFRGALELLHASYIGYHGDARDWLNDNPKLTGELLNRCGYWYFLDKATLPRQWQAGQSNTLTLTWRNRGVAPAYHAYTLTVRLEGPKTWQAKLDAGNRKWLPDSSASADYQIQLPDSLPSGKYTLKTKLHSPQANKDVRLALQSALLDAEGFYRIADIPVINR